MKNFFWAVLSLLIFGLLARIDIGGAGILATDIVVPLFVIAWGGRKLLLKESWPRLAWLEPAWLFVFVAFVSFWWGAFDLPFKDGLVSAAYLVRLVLFLLFAWATTDIFGQLNIKKIRGFFWNPFFKIVAIVVGVGFLQFYLMPDISDYSTEGGLDPHVGRLLGTWLDPNYLAGFLGFVLPLGIAYWYNMKKIGGKIWLGFLLLTMLVALFLTFSRSGYLAAALGLGFFFAWKDPKVLLLGALVVVLGVATNERAQQRIGELGSTMSAVIFQETDEIDPTASLRIQNWRKSFTLFEKHPVLGIGYNTYRYRAAEEGIVDENYFSAGGADSTHLTVLVTTGFLGFLAYLYWLYAMWKQNFRGFLRKTSTKRWFHLGFCAGLISLLVHACFVNSLFFPLIFLPVMAVAGVLAIEE